MAINYRIAEKLSNFRQFILESIDFHDSRQDSGVIPRLRMWISLGQKPVLLSRVRRYNYDERATSRCQTHTLAVHSDFTLITYFIPMTENQDEIPQKTKNAFVYDVHLCYSGYCNRTVVAKSESDALGIAREMKMTASDHADIIGSLDPWYEADTVEVSMTQVPADLEQEPVPETDVTDVDAPDPSADIVGYVYFTVSHGVTVRQWVQLLTKEQVIESALDVHQDYIDDHLHCYPEDAECPDWKAECKRRRTAIRKCEGVDMTEDDDLCILAIVK